MNEVRSAEQALQVGLEDDGSGQHLSMNEVRSAEQAQLQFVASLVEYDGVAYPQPPTGSVGLFVVTVNLEVCTWWSEPHPQTPPSHKEKQSGEPIKLS